MILSCDASTTPGKSYFKKCRYMNDVLPSVLDDARSIVEASARRARRTPTKFDGDIFDTIFEGEEIMSHF